MDNALFGNAGNGILRATEPGSPANDRLNCGTGTDRTFGDRHDTLTPECENNCVSGEWVPYGVWLAARPALVLPVKPITLDARGRGTLR